MILTSSEPTKTRKLKLKPKCLERIQALYPRMTKDMDARMAEFVLRIAYVVLIPLRRRKLPQDR